MTAGASLKIGCHISSSGGYLAMGEHALSLGATTFAFFTRNPRGGTVKPFDPADAEALSALLARECLGPLVAHAPYTYNLCSAKDDVRAFAQRSMAEDLARLESIPGCYYNFHPGSHVGQGEDAGIELICAALSEILAEGHGTRVLLETMAGKGSEVGRSFEEIARIIEGTAGGDALGVCLDSCHVHDAGYDIAGDLDGVLAEFDRVIGLERLCVLHLNDSKNPLGARKDRHEKIGEGYLGRAAFACIVCHPVLSGLPMILETPNDDAGYAAEIALLRSLAG